MQFEQDGDTFIIYLEKDDCIMESLTKFCKDQNIDNGKISGIGAIKEIELGAYDLSNKEYITQSFEEVWELTSFQGNIQLKEGNPFIHAHINISNHDLKVKGGHLFEATVAAVGEFVLNKINTKGKRVLNPDIGLACMVLSR
ncbi:DNA-binding protein [bacterium]|nr:MAG: DNA-binding protein [bacterium]